MWVPFCFLSRFDNQLGNFSELVRPVHLSVQLFRQFLNV